MKLPASLYRYRPLNDDILDRELNALINSYLFSSLFSAMNDPMEAFYETGGLEDGVINALLSPSGKRLDDIYVQITDMIKRSALVSFSSTHNDLPMWAYYSSSFAGMCLELKTNILSITNKNEKLCKVSYARHALRPITITDLMTDMETAVVSRITRKRIEWAHEKEWRLITGETGPKYFLDDALSRVFIGPRVKAEHATRVCEILNSRPVEILQGTIKGFELTFHSIKPATEFGKCESTGARNVSIDDAMFEKEEITKFLKVPLRQLSKQLEQLCLHPNMEKFGVIGITDDKKPVIFVWINYKLRNGNIIWHKCHFDCYAILISEPPSL